MFLCRQFSNAFVALSVGLTLTACASAPEGAPQPPLEADATTADSPEVTGAAPPTSDVLGLDQRPKSMAQIYRGTGRFVNPAPLREPRAEIVGGDIIMNFDETEITDVVDIVLGQTLGLTYVVDPKVAGQVSLSTSQPVPAEAALEILESILRMNGAALVIDGDIYRVLPLADARTTLVEAPVLDLGDARPGYALQIVPLRYVSAVEMEKVLAAFTTEGSLVRVDAERNLLVLAGTSAELRTLADTVRIFDVDFLAGTSVGVFPLNQVSAETAIEELETILASGDDGVLSGLIRMIPIERLNAVLVATKNPSYLDRIERWISRLDRATSTGLNLYVYYVENGKAANLASILSDVFSVDSGNDDAPVGRVAPGLTERRDGVTITTATPATGNEITRTVEAAPIPPASGRDAAAGNGLRVGTSDPVSYSPSSQIKIIADEDNNALLILATAQDYRMVEAALRKLDIVPLQVLVEATIAEVTLTDELRYGLQYSFDFESGSTTNTASFISAADGTLGSTFPGMNVVTNSLSDNVTVVLDALETITDVQVISSPHLLVQDNQSAELQVGAQVPVVTQLQQSSINPNPNLLNTVEFRDTGVILRVTPRITAGGQISLEIEQEVSSVADQGETLTPTISTRIIKSSVVVLTGETVVLGGLISDDQNFSRSGLPGLSRLPVLGNFFGRTQNTDRRTELIVFISPQIVRDASDAERVSRELSNRIRGLRSQTEVRLGSPMFSEPQGR